MKNLVLYVAVMLLPVLFGCAKYETSDKAGGSNHGTTQTQREDNTMASATLTDIGFKTITGEETSLADYDGKVKLIVNVASKCGFTPQYHGLEKLYEDKKDQGFVILAFPANNFRDQEPGTNEEILNFCQSNYKVTFPMMSKISVKGDDIHPLFAELTQHSDIPGDIKWNFSKFLLDRSGNLVARYESSVTPDDSDLAAKIDSLLAAK